AGDPGYIDPRPAGHRHPRPRSRLGIGHAALLVAARAEGLILVGDASVNVTTHEVVRRWVRCHGRGVVDERRSRVEHVVGAERELHGAEGIAGEKIEGRVRRDVVPGRPIDGTLARAGEIASAVVAFVAGADESSVEDPVETTVGPR